METEMVESKEVIRPKTIKDEFAKFCVPAIDTITQSEIDNFQPAHIRYYTEKYCIKFNETKRLDILLRVHTNKLVLVYLSREHEIIRKNKNVLKFDFSVDDEDRKDIKLSGKGKKGAKILQPNSVICNIETDDGEKYPVYACVHGKLVEINEQLSLNPNVIKNNNGTGFIGIIIPDLGAKEDNIITKEAYLEYCVLESEKKLNNMLGYSIQDA